MHLVVVGGSDAGISAALRAREVAPDTDVTVVVADRFPKLSICGIPYHVAGDVPRWPSLAHRGVPELEVACIQLRLNTMARRIDPVARRLTVGTGEEIAYDELVIGTGAVPIRPSIAGLDRPDPAVDRVGDAGGRLAVSGSAEFRREVDLVLVVVGVRPDTALAEAVGAELGVRGAIKVDRSMRTSVPHVWAAGDCVVTHHRLLGETYLPPGTTAHKQGRVAEENAVGGSREYAGSLGSQVVKVFDLVVGRTGLRDAEAKRAGFQPVTVAATADNDKAYYPGAQPIPMRWTGDHASGRLLGVQLVGRLGSEVAKRVDVAAAAIHTGRSVAEISDLDLTYTPPLGSPWDAVQIGAQAWEALPSVTPSLRPVTFPRDVGSAFTLRSSTERNRFMERP